MAVRKTERRVPSGFQPSDLGQAVVAPTCALISFATAPLVVARDHTYVLLVTDAALASRAASFEWTFIENAGPPTMRATAISEVVYSPSAPGNLIVKVTVLDGAGSEQVSITLEQPLIAPSEQLEALVTRTQNTPGPGGGDPVVLRELVNEHATYYQQVTPRVQERGDGFRRFLFGMVLDGALRQSAAERRKHLQELTSALNGASADFARLTAKGTGVCNLRLPLLAMILPQATGGAALLPWTELPVAATRRAFAEERLRQTVAGLPEDTRIDLFNVARFPKSNIMACARVVEALRDRYFGGTNFNDVLAGMSGTRAHWIIRHFREGPLSAA